MLCISRRPGEKVRLIVDGRVITILLTASNNRTARLGIEAPKEVKILREEIYQRYTAEEENVEIVNDSIINIGPVS